MVIKDDEYGEFDVNLVDDGTLDTVISVQRRNEEHHEHKTEMRFSTEYAAQYRNENGAVTDDGFDVLASEAITAHIEQYLI